jgi:protein arginine N-methyltransferase 5
VIDAIDAFPSLDRSESRKSEEESLKSTAGVIKIGQTSLHNPGGRSSWIGL